MLQVTITEERVRSSDRILMRRPLSRRVDELLLLDEYILCRLRGGKMSESSVSTNLRFKTYPLLRALIERRSRRFARGMKLEGGPPLL